MGSCLVQMHNCRDDVLFFEVVFKETVGIIKVFSLFLNGFSFQPVRGSAHETVLHNHAVLSSLSSDFFNPVQYCLAVFCRRLDNVIVQVRPRRVNIGIAFILGFQSFVVIAYPADSAELAFFYAHNRVICHRHFSPYRFIFKEVIIQNVSLNYLPLYHFAENGRND